MKNDSKLMKALIGAALSAALLTTPLVASATLFQVQITGTGAFAGINYNSGIMNATDLNTNNVFSGADYSFDISSNNAPGGSPSYLDSTFGAYDKSTTSGTITILASATDYSSLAAGSSDYLLSHIGGTNSHASVTAQAWINSSDILNGMTGNFTLQGPFSSQSYSNDATTAFIAANPFSITQRIVLNVAAHGYTTGDFNTTIPEPSTLALLGLGLLAAGALRRRQA